MRKIIDGREYDTAAKRRLCSWSPTNDYADSGTTLFRMRSGEYFIEGWLGGDPVEVLIIPVDDITAMCLAESHMDADEYEAEFGPVEE